MVEIQGLWSAFHAPGGDLVVHRDLRDYDVMAWDFVMNFARDNGLQLAEACLLPDLPPVKVTA